MLAEVGGIQEKQVVEPFVPIALILIDDTIRPSALADHPIVRGRGRGSQDHQRRQRPDGFRRRAARRRSQRAEGVESGQGHRRAAARTGARNTACSAACTPAQKKILIETFQNSGQTRARWSATASTTSSRSNRPNCSIALAGGSEAARSISHLVLIDNDFSSLPSVVREGRQIVNNMQNASVLYLVKTLYTILLTVALLLTRNIYPLRARPHVRHRDVHHRHSLVFARARTQRQGVPRPLPAQRAPRRSCPARS
ncbi:MAG: hypothetical protein MZU97_01525 [Bacillus subtilis]|nr:hypothetical protein [Bacillus subtilis]